MRTVASFEIHFHGFLDADGVACADLPAFARHSATLRELYRLIRLTRVFDTKAVALQRTGQLGTYASVLGQEAIGVGFGTAMQASDVLVPGYREHAAQIARGVTLTELLIYWGGDERGSDFAGPREDFPVAIPVASQCCHAVGAAAAFQTRGEARAAVVTLGDGATSKGDFYESLNIAGAWRLPALFVVSNNQWAISVPRRDQCAAETLAQKAIAAGVPGLQVDGNDVVAVRWAAEQALARARAGEGPTLIEALTYRMQDHTTADDAKRYRDPAEVERHRALDPIERLRKHLVSEHGWSTSDEACVESDCVTQLQQALDGYAALPPAGPEALFDYLYAELPGALAAQREAVIAEERSGG